MKKWTKENALEAIHKLIEQISIAQSKGRESEEHIRWLANALRILEEIFGGKSRYYLTLASYKWRETGAMMLDAYDMEY